LWLGGLVEEMVDGRAGVTADLVRQLIAEQAPQWAGWLPVGLADSPGLRRRCVVDPRESRSVATGNVSGRGVRGYLSGRSYPRDVSSQTPA